MRQIAVAADRVGCWIRRNAIQVSCGTHLAQNKSRLNLALARMVGQCLKDQYDAFATPSPRILLLSSDNSKRSR
jgi:hypothetical protein